MVHVHTWRVSVLSVPCAVPVQCDSGNDQELAALFERIEKEAGRLDVLVNNAFSGVCAYAVASV